MAITGAIFKTLTFNGESSKDYGVYITGAGVYDAPKRDVEMITIAGRNGSFPLDHGRFENIEVTYPAGIFGDNEEDFADAISDFRNMLCSANGYCRLEDEYNPDEYRMAVYKSGLEVDPTLLKAGEFEITFECKPQRYLKSGEIPVTMGDWTDVETHTGNPIILNTDKEVKSLDVELTPIQDLHGYDKPWAGGAGKNLLNVNSRVNQTNAQVIYTSDENYVILNGTKYGSSYADLTTLTITLSAGTYYARAFEISGTGESKPSVYVFDGSQSLTASILHNEEAFTLSEEKTVYFRFAMWSDNKTYTDYTIGIVVSKTSGITEWTPYSNICPITGHDSVSITDTGKNVALLSADNIGSHSNSTVTYLDGGATVTVTGGYGRTGWLIPVTNGTTYTISLYALVSDTSAGHTNRIYIGNTDSVWNVSTTGYKTHFAVTGTRTKYTYTFTADTTTIFIGAYIGGSAGDGSGTITELQVEQGSTATDYVPYKEPVITTVTLPHTVYGAGVGVTSGSGKEKYAIVDLGTLTWSQYQDQFYANLTGVYQPLYGVKGNAYCTALEVVAMSQITSKDNVIALNNGQPRVNARATQYATAADFKTAMSGVYLCYELATYTDLNTTPTDITLYNGDNVVSSDGDMTLEIGKQITGVDNPTRFEASPELQIKGYGTVAFNGYEIVLNNVVYGDVILAEDKNEPSGIFDLGSDVYANNGDPLTIVVNPAAIIKAPSAPISYADNESASSNGTHKFVIESYITAKISFNGSTFSFTKGTSDSGSIYAQYDVHYVNKTSTVRVTFTITYNATADTITITTALTSSPYTFTLRGTEYILASARVDSSKSVLGDPTIIDCENGEAYKIDTDKAVPLNRYVDLGTDLPKLATGENPITTTGSITECVIIPRWWKL